MPSEQPFTGQPGNRPEAGGDSDQVVTRRLDRIEAWSRGVVLHLLWIAPAAAALALQFRAFDGLYLSDAMDLGQIGRHLADGQGLVTTFLRPVEVALYPQIPAPEICHAPLYPLLLGLVFNLLPRSDAVMAGVSAFFFFITLPLIYLLASRVFDRAGGILAAVIFALSGQALAYAVSGLHVTLWAFLLTLTAYLLYGNAGSARRSVAAGAVFGLCWLTEYMTFALIAPALIAAFYAAPERRLRHLGWFVVGLIAVMLPWWVRNCLLAHNPLFTLDSYALVMFTRAHPGHTLFRIADASALRLPALVAEEPRGLLGKELLGLGSAYRTIAPLVGLYVVGFFVIALMRRLAGPRQNFLRVMVVLLLVFLGVIGAAHNPSAELFFVLVPLIVVLCAGYFVVLAREWIRTTVGQAAAVAIFVLIAAYPAFVSWALPQPKGISDKANLDYLRRTLPPNAVVVTDIPWAVAWYAQRPAVWLPLDWRDFQRVQRKIGVDAIYFSALLPGYPSSEQALAWQRLYAERGVPPGFEPAALPQPQEMLLLKAPLRPPGETPSE